MYICHSYSDIYLTKEKYYTHTKCQNIYTIPAFLLHKSFHIYSAGPQLLSGLAGLASGHRLSPLCRFDPTSDNIEDPYRHDPGCCTVVKTQL